MSRAPETVRGITDVTAYRAGRMTGAPSWPRPVVERFLADRGLAAEPLHVGMQVHLQRREPVTLGYQADDVVARGSDPDALAQREERDAEEHDDPREQRANGAGPLGDPDAASS